MYYIIGIIILLIFSAFFSSSETILFLAKDFGLKKDKKRYNYIYQKQEEFLTIILFSNTIVNIFLGMLFEYYTTNILFPGVNLIYVIISTTFILLTFGEVLPKRLSLAFYKSLYEKYFSILLIIERVLKYINFLFNFIIKPFKKIKKEEQYFTFKEVKDFIYDSYKNKIISELEFHLFYRLFNLKNVKASNFIIPYTKIKVFTLHKLKEYIKNNFQKIKELNQEIIPIYDSKFENIIGFIKKVDLLDLYYRERFKNKIFFNQKVESDTGYGNNNERNDKNIDQLYEYIKVDDLEKIILKPVFVYIEQQISQVINLFNENKCEILIVIDQYFQFKGIIRYNDIQNYLLTLDIPDNKNEIYINPDITSEELKYYYNIIIPSKYKNLHQFLIPYILKDVYTIKYKKYKFVLLFDNVMNNNIKQKKIYNNKFFNNKNYKERKLKDMGYILPDYKIKIIKSE